MSRATTKNIEIRTGEYTFSVKKNGNVVNADTRTLNITGATVSDEGNQEVEVSFDRINYETVTSIPSYLLPDGEIVIDNGNGTYDVLKTYTDSLLLSNFGAISDLEYFNVTTDGTTAVILYAGFDQSYVGKKIRIKAAHQNPDTAGTEVPNTTLGRIVTVSAEILSVVNGVSATIDFIPNKAGALRAYCFTNNTEPLHRALRFCQYRKIQELVVDFDGILGFDPYDKGLYASETTVGNDVYLSNSGIRITSQSAKFKMTNEFDDSPTAFFNLLTGSNNFHIDFPILPADEFAQDPQKNNKAIVQINGAGNSIRTITIENQNYSKTDLDGNDSWWNKIVLGDSTGGKYSAADGRESQKLILKNNGARCKNGSYTNFQNDGYSNEMWFYDVHFNDIQHYTGENGRSFQPDNNLNTMEWQYNTGNFSVVSNVVTTTDPDFSWYDHQPASISITVTINGQTATIASITDAKTAVLNAGIGNISGQNCKINLTGRTYFDHPMYLHPSMICQMVRCKSNPLQVGKIKMYSDGGTVQDELGRWRIIDCVDGLYELEAYSGGTSSTACITHISNSKVTMYSISGYCYAKNSEIKGKFVGHEFKSLGGNIYGDGSPLYFNASINDNNLAHYHNSDRGSFQFYYGGTGNYVKVSNIDIGEPNGIGTITGYLPQVKDGICDIKDVRVENSSNIANWLVSWILSTTELRFENLKIVNQVGGDGFLKDVGFNTALFTKWVNSNYYQDYTNSNPITFDETGINVGKFNITRDVGNRFYGKRFKPNFTRWWAYKELEYLAINLTDADDFIVEDFSFSSIIGTFLVNRDITNPAIATGETGNASAFTYNTLPLFKGEFKLKFKGTCICSPYHHTNGAGANNSSLRENTTLSNMVVKSLDRIDGEIVTFEVDPIDGRAIEVDSSIKTKYTSLKPTRLGVEGEKLYKDDGSGQYWECEIDFVDDSTNSYAGTQTDVGELNDVGGATQTNTHIDITGTPEWSIGQEKTDGSPLLDFDFTLNIDGGGTLEFEYETTIDISGGNKTVNAHYNKYLWQFKQTGGSGYRCFMNNRTGQIVFNGTISETLDIANIITINSGDKITRREWVLKGSGIIKNDTSTSYNFVIEDAGNPVTFDNASPITADIPTNATIKFPIPTKIPLFNKGVGVVTIGGAGVTILQNVGGLTMAQNDARTLTKIDTDTWVLGY